MKISEFIKISLLKLRRLVCSSAGNPRIHESRSPFPHPLLANMTPWKRFMKSRTMAASSPSAATYAESTAAYTESATASALSVAASAERASAAADRAAAVAETAVAATAMAAANTESA